MSFFLLHDKPWEFIIWIKTEHTDSSVLVVLPVLWPEGELHRGPPFLASFIVCLISTQFYCVEVTLYTYSDGFYAQRFENPPHEWDHRGERSENISDVVKGIAETLFNLV